MTSKLLLLVSTGGLTQPERSPCTMVTFSSLKYQELQPEHEARQDPSSAQEDQRGEEQRRSRRRFRARRLRHRRRHGYLCHQVRFWEEK